jgi:two-component system, chemotaxis family, chemotaxis protein CheY
MKILIVDDDPTFRMLLKKILERYGLSNYEFAVDGQNAIENFTHCLDTGQPYDLIFLDVNMPNKNGINTIQEIRAMERARRIDPNKFVKVIMITSTTDDIVLANAYESLCDGYVVKPYNQSTIIDQLKALGVPMKDN